MFCIAKVCSAGRFGSCLLGCVVVAAHRIGQPGVGVRVHEAVGRLREPLEKRPHLPIAPHPIGLPSGPHDRTPMLHAAFYDVATVQQCCTWVAPSAQFSPTHNGLTCAIDSKNASVVCRRGQTTAKPIHYCSVRRAQRPLQDTHPTVAVRSAASHSAAGSGEGFVREWHPTRATGSSAAVGTQTACDRRERSGMQRATCRQSTLNGYDREDDGATAGTQQAIHAYSMGTRLVLAWVLNSTAKGKTDLA